MMKIFLILLLSVILHAEAKYCQKSECYPKTSSINGKDFPLQGVGLFRYLGFRIYSLSLYANQKTDLLSLIPKKIVIRYFRDFTVQDLIKSGEDEIKEQNLIKLDKIESQLEKLRSLYKPVKENDEYAIEYTPKIGLTFYLNNQLQGTIEGDDFAKAYLGIWLSDDPISTTVREQIMESQVNLN